MKTLTSRLQTLRTGTKPLDITPGATPRLRGSSAVKRRAQWLADHPMCKHCAAQGRATVGDEVDHTIPLEQGGADDESNFQTLCSPCHKAKTAAEATRRSGAVRTGLVQTGYGGEGRRSNA